ncbi:MAG: hypothetical protein ACXWIU_06970 [Limisphaerales bacterium]
MSVRYLVILPAADQTQANALAKSEFDSDGGEKTFTVALSATGKPPATHYWCSALFFRSGPERLLAAQALFPDAVILDYDGSADAGFPQRAIQNLGLKQIVTLPER